MYWNGDYSQLYHNYELYQKDIITEYQFNLSRSGWLGDQAYIGESINHDLFENMFGSNFIGWRHHKINTKLIDPSILVFTGNQKPNNNLRLKLVQQFWI
jgi:hypothetical protein